jgi:para-nitrobenzyl esterase
VKKRRIWLGLLITIVLVPAALTVAVFVSANRPPPSLVLGQIVQIESGAIQGAAVDDIAVYRGIPFAAAPLGALRWRAPQPVESWTGVRRVTHFKPSCMQPALRIPGLETGPISEDCLYLNVWAPRKRPQERLPVMVYLHGGGGMVGSASSRLYWGDELARHGVITVNLSYRVGILGWLAHPDLTREASYGASGNYAVLDMIAGLRWVRRNIAAFGGDPNNVTLFGQSAGAFNASRLMTSPLAEGLFHKVIGQSGGDFHPTGTSGGNVSLAEAERSGVEFATSLGAASIEELRKIPAEKILQAPLPKSQTRLPVIDGYVAVADNQALYKQGKQAKIPILVGYNEREGDALLDPMRPPPPTTAAEVLASIEESYGDYTPRMLEMYPVRTEAEALESFARLTGEQAINWNTATWARLHAATGESGVYFYYFRKRPPFGPFRRVGAAHGTELPYVFGAIPKWMRVFTQWPWKARQDLELTRQIPAYWTNFAKTGNPNGEGLPEWPSYKASEQALHFAEGGTAAGEFPHQAEHAHMDRYFESLRRIDEAEHIALPRSSSGDASAQAAARGREF